MDQAAGTALRQRFCRWIECGALFWICRRCDRGQQYCSDRCRYKGRRCQRRQANRRHQQSPEGRLDHRDRQRVWRQHRKARVTDQPSPSRFPCASVARPDQTPCNSGPAEALNDPLRNAGFRWNIPISSYLQSIISAPMPVCIICGCLGRFINPFAWG